MVPGSAEYEMASDYMDVIAEHPELGSDPAAAQAALATAAHLANVFDRPEMGTDPGVIATAHVLNEASAQREQAAQQPMPPDPVETILSGGKGGAGGRVLEGI